MATLVASHVSRSFGDGPERQVVLDDLTLELSSPALVAVLGESGCGKTTLLNILGGLDRAFEGSLVVDGRDTGSFSEADWDHFRAREVGLVFQSPNLIGHLSVAENVRLAQSLAGVPPAVAQGLRERALERCGIKELAGKRPATLSGGQAQRVSVARALAKDPAILLADEPTGSLDEESGRAVMELLVELAQERLVIVVTHNERLARAYATEVLHLEGGRIVREEPAIAREQASTPKAAGSRASHREIARLALRHVRRRKGRSLVTGAAVALAALSTVLMVALGLGSHGFLERLALGLSLAHPIVVTSDPSLDLSVADGAAPGDALVVSDAGARALEALAGADGTGASLGGLYRYLTLSHPELAEGTLDIQRGYDLELNLYDSEGEQLLRAGSPVLGERLSRTGLVEPELRSQIESRLSSADLMRELVRNDVTGETPYEVLAGRLPESSDEVVIIVGQSAEMLDLVAAELGLMSTDELMETLGDGTPGAVELPYDDILGTTYRLVPTASYYYRDASGTRWVDARTDEGSIRLPEVVDDGRELTVVGVVRPQGRYADASFAGAIGYDASLVTALVEDAWESGVVRDQAAHPERDVFSGRGFENGLTGDDVGADDLMALAEQLGLSQAKLEVLASLSDGQAGALASRLGYAGDLEGAQLDDERLEELSSLSDGEFARLVERYATADLSSSYAQNMAWLGGVDLDEPTELRIYVDDAEQTELVRAAVSDYARLQGLEGGALSCASDMQQLIDQSNATVATIDLVLVVLSLILGALSLFLVASTTSISALERTGEIAVLRALGATRGSVTALFLYENLVIGALAGLCGALLAWSLAPLLDSYVTMFTNMGSLVTVEWWACLPAAAGCGALTALAGLVPARRAARRDPAGIVRDLTV